MEWWLRIASETQPSGVPVPKKTRVRALSCLTNSQWELKQLPEDEPDVVNIDSVHRAGAFANKCASLGFVSPVMLLVGGGIQYLMRGPVVPQAYRARLSALEHLWEVVEKRDQEVQQDQMRRAKKVARAPNAYVCAAEGCNIQAARKAALLRCAGKCLMNVKPAYCSKECQRAVSSPRSIYPASNNLCSQVHSNQDWKRHKPVCRPPSVASSSNIDIQQLESEAGAEASGSKDVAAGSLNSKAAITDADLRTDGREVSITIPRLGDAEGKTTIISKTMSTRLMKDLRDGMKSLVLEEEEN